MAASRNGQAVTIRSNGVKSERHQGACIRSTSRYQREGHTLCRITPAGSAKEGSSLEGVRRRRRRLGDIKRLRHRGCRLWPLTSEGARVAGAAIIEARRMAYHKRYLSEEGCSGGITLHPRCYRLPSPPRWLSLATRASPLMPFWRTTCYRRKRDMASLRLPASPRSWRRDGYIDNIATHPRGVRWLRALSEQGGGDGVDASLCHRAWRAALRRDHLPASHGNEISALRRRENITPHTSLPYRYSWLWQLPSA